MSHVLKSKSVPKDKFVPEKEHKSTYFFFLLGVLFMKLR